MNKEHEDLCDFVRFNIEHKIKKFLASEDILIGNSLEQYPDSVYSSKQYPVYSFLNGVLKTEGESLGESYFHKDVNKTINVTIENFNPAELCSSGKDFKVSWRSLPRLEYVNNLTREKPFYRVWFRIRVER